MKKLLHKINNIKTDFVKINYKYVILSIWWIHFYWL